MPIEHGQLNYTATAMKFAGKINAVSKLHAEVSREMWSNNEIIAITNAQDFHYWHDPALSEAIESDNTEQILQRKAQMKAQLFKEVANQCGKIFDPDILTIVWARRFAGYKRADLILKNLEKFESLIKNKDLPVQIIWAGKPYPEDWGSIQLYNNILFSTQKYKNCAMLTGYELQLSALLKKGSDVWLNNPSMYREASGTSGMSAAMNGSINLTLPDGWIPEFGINGENSFVVEPLLPYSNLEEREQVESQRILDIISNHILPLYYNNKSQWIKMMKNGYQGVIHQFDSRRMATEYYELMYN